MRFAICRVIGNELPPRDHPRGKLLTLEYILEHERDIPRVWVLNHLHDSDYREHVLKLLVSHAEPFEEIIFDPRHYLTLSAPHERIRYAINVNHARNRAIEIARRENDFAVSLDQNCFFTPELWDQTVHFICEDQLRCPERQYYGLMMKRLLDPDPAGADDMPDEEPQIVFRRDAPALFDPQLTFGVRDKAELLRTLGYGSPPEYRLTSDVCRTAGNVLHLRSGPPVVERYLRVRELLRVESLARLLKSLDSKFGARWLIRD